MAESLNHLPTRVQTLSGGGGGGGGGEGGRGFFVALSIVFLQFEPSPTHTETPL